MVVAYRAQNAAALQHPAPEKPSAGVLAAFGLAIEPRGAVIRRQGSMVALSPQEFAIFHMLSEAYPGPVARFRIAHKVFPASAHSMDVVVSNLRAKIAILGVAVLSAKTLGIRLRFS